MTTKVKIELVEHVGWNVTVNQIRPDGSSVGAPTILTEKGESVEFYVHSGNSVKVDEVPN